MPRVLLFSHFSVSSLPIPLLLLCLLLAACSDGPMGPVEQSAGAEQGDSDSSDSEPPDLTGQSASAPRFSPYGVKQLAISWEAVDGADYYRLWVSENGGQDYLPAVEALPGVTVKHGLSAHLALNTVAYLEACNAGGCTTPSPVTRLADLHAAGAFSLLDIIGVFKPAPFVSVDGRTVRPLFKGYSLSSNQEGTRWISGIPALSEYQDSDANELNFQGGFVTFGDQEGSWSLEGYNVDPEEPQAGNYLGLATAMSGDGQWLVVSAPGRSLTVEAGTASNAGAVYVYRRNNRDDGWVATQEITPSSVDAVGHFGRVLALSSDASTLAVVTPATETGRGHVHLYRLADGYFDWQQTIVNPGGAFGGKRFGEGLALSPNGRYLAIGAPNVYGPDLFGGNSMPIADSTEAAVGLWREEQGQWRLVGDKVIKDPQVSGFGEHLAFFKDGGYLLVGAPDSESGRGRAFLYLVLQAGAVLQAVSSFEPPRHVTEVDSRAFGMRLAVTPDGKFIAIAAPFSGVATEPDNTSFLPDVGAVFVYRDQGTEWILESVQTPPGIHKESAFGMAVALRDGGRSLLIGAPAYASDEVATASEGQPMSVPLGAVFIY
ncbi:MAG: integrin alpha [Marinobacter sp.]|nr:integrin alpha [Marinobacter sp.]